MLSCLNGIRLSTPGPTFSKLLMKILGRFLILGQSLTISGKTLTRHNFTLIHDLTTTSRNNIQHDAKIKVLITIIIALLFPNSRVVLCQIFSCDYPKIRNLPKIFLRSFENVGPEPTQTVALESVSVDLIDQFLGRLTFWRLLLPHGYCYKASCTRLG